MWWQEITSFVPNSFSKARQPLSDVVAIRTLQFPLKVCLHISGIKSEHHFSDLGSLMIKIQELTKNTPKIRIELNFDSESVLVLKENYPEAAEEKINQIASTLFHQKLPFAENEVYTDNFLSKRLEQSSEISISHGFVKRKIVDEIIEFCTQNKLQNFAIRPFPNYNYFDFTPDYILKTRQNSRRRKIMAFMFLVIGSLSLTLFSYAERQKSLLTSLDTRLATAQKKAVEVREQKNFLSEKIAMIDQLRNVKKYSPSMLKLWRDMSLSLPQDTSINLLSYREGKAEISGFSNDSANLLTTLEQLDNISDVSFNAPVTLDRQSQKEKFILSFTYKSDLARSIKPSDER